MKKIIKGLAMHVHHAILFEYCYDFDEKEAIAELPEKILKAYAELDKVDAKRDKAIAKWYKAYAEWKKAYAEWNKADAELDKAYAEWNKAIAEWNKADAERWHKKHCGCREWNGEEIDFTK